MAKYDFYPVVLALKEKKDWALIQKEIKFNNASSNFTFYSFAPLLSLYPGALTLLGVNQGMLALGYGTINPYFYGIMSALSWIMCFRWFKKNRSLKLSPQINKEEFFLLLPEKEKKELADHHRLKELQAEYEADVGAFGVKYFGNINTELALALGRVNKDCLLRVVNPDTEWYKQLKELLMVKNHKV